MLKRALAANALAGALTAGLHQHDGNVHPGPPMRAEVMMLLPGDTGTTAPGLQDFPPKPHFELGRHNSQETSRSHDRKPLSNRYWYGYPAYFEALSAHEKQNALILYQVGIALGKTVDDIGCTDNIAYRESHLEEHAQNPSGAYGLGQALPASKMAPFGTITIARNQGEWMYSYEDKTYGGACPAWIHWLANGSY